jgi:hypothetical protein
MRTITAFYAWQSDTPERFNRHLIQIALEEAAKRITEDPSLHVELIVDYDTAGVPGTPPISETILKKVADCDIFIPDVSFVARTDGGKLVPNPNVMTEYGYALCAKTHVAMMPVMNTAFGPPEELPFDMGHLRHPIQYRVEPTAKPAQRRAVRQALSQQVEEKLRLQIAATEPPRPAPPPFARVEPKDGPGRFRPPGEPIGKRWDDMLAFTGDTGNNISLVVGPTMWLRLMPVVEPGKKWPAHELKRQAVIQNGGVNLLPFTDNPIYMLRAEDGIAICPLMTADGVETPSVAFAFETGEVWSIDTWLLACDPIRLFVGEIEGLFTRRLQAYARFLAGLGLAPPYRWIGGLVGVKGRRLQIPPRPGRMQLGLGPECLSEIIIEQGLYDGEQTPSSALYSLFKEIFDKCGIPRPDHLPRRCFLNTIMMNSPKLQITAKEIMITERRQAHRDRQVATRRR